MTAIILDCDPGHDDAVALLLAVASEEISLLAVTTVAGNQTLDKTTSNALRVLDCAGAKGVPVAAGADRPLTRTLQVADDVHGETGLDGAVLPQPSREADPLHATVLMADLIASSSLPVTIVATGPLTNVALLLARYPEIEGSISRVVLMGGSIGEGNVTPAAEFNIWTDPEAASRVFTSTVPLTMVGLDATHQALISWENVRSLRQGGPRARLIAELYEFYIPVHERRYGWTGAPAHDAMALAYVIDPTMFVVQSLRILIDTGPMPSQGRTYVDVWKRTSAGRECDVVVGVDSDRFLELLMTRLADRPAAGVAQGNV